MNARMDGLADGWLAESRALVCVFVSARRQLGQGRRRCYQRLQRHPVADRTTSTFSTFSTFCRTRALFGILAFSSSARSGENLCTELGISDSSKRKFLSQLKSKLLLEGQGRRNKFLSFPSAIYCCNFRSILVVRSHKFSAGKQLHARVSTNHLFRVDYGLF